MGPYVDVVLMPHVRASLCGPFPPCRLRRREYGAPPSRRLPVFPPTINNKEGNGLVCRWRFNASRPCVSMWKLPSLSSASEGIWSAAVPAASRIPFESDGKDGKI